MNEKITDKVTRSARIRQVVEKLDEGVKDKTKYSVTPLLSLINHLVQDAYLAGINKVNLTESRKEPIIDTGELLVLAKNYCKDKGLST